MSKKFPTLDQALEIDNEIKEKFGSLKIQAFQDLRSINNTFLYSLFEKEEKEKFNEYIEDITGVMTADITSADDNAALEYINNNIQEILNENRRFEIKIKKIYKDTFNKDIIFENFKENVNYIAKNSSEDPFSDNQISIPAIIIEQFKEEKDSALSVIRFQLDMLYKSCMAFKNLKDNFNDYLKIYINKSVESVKGELESFRRLRSIADTALTENIYNSAVSKYKRLEEDYRNYFYWCIGILLVISICLFLIKSILVPLLVNNIEFWVIKISVIAVGITLISYFLKQSAHYQRLADQNYQTQVELQAYPSFMESIPTEEAASVRKELALKYFGREIDGTAHKDMSNLISDQMKSTTEMVKATTEAIKNLKG